jgi:hypothetical protein
MTPSTNEPVTFWLVEQCLNTACPVFNMWNIKLLMVCLMCIYSMFTEVMATYFRMSRN